MQGKSKTAVDEVYFLDDPETLREEYIKHLNCLTVNMDVNQLDIKSPEFVQLETENISLKEELSKVDDIMKRLSKLESKEAKLKEKIGKFVWDYLGFPKAGLIAQESMKELRELSDKLTENGE